jgi:hypothetical protein
MPAPPTYFDESVDHGIVEPLRRRTLAVTTARSEGRQGAADEEQHEFSTQRGLLLVSHNQRDFWRLHTEWTRRGRVHAGIVAVPESRGVALETRRRRLAIRVAMLVDWIGLLADHRGRFFRWGDLQAQLEAGFRLPGYGEEDVRTVLGRHLSGTGESSWPTRPGQRASARWGELLPGAFRFQPG